jgi:hypothetical protein
MGGNTLMKQWLKDFIHNAIIHPLMILLPEKFATRFHDWNARWAFKEYYDELKLEGKKRDH